MQIYNYLRPLWCNGPHVVHDAPPEVRTALDLTFKGRPPGRESGDLVKLHRIAPLDLTVAFVVVEVELPVQGTNFSYRRARYVHALAACGRAGGDALSPRRSRAFFEDVYGEDVTAGIEAAQRRLCSLEHPAQGEVARDYFAGVVPPSRSVSPTRQRSESAVAPPPAATGRVTAAPACEIVLEPPPALPPAVTSPHWPEQSTTSASAAPPNRPAPSRAEAAQVIDGSLPRTAEPLPTPVEAFDRAFARRASERSAAETCSVSEARTDSVPVAVKGPPAEPTSLSTLLHARLPGELPGLEGFGPGTSAAGHAPARKPDVDAASPTTGAADDATGCASPSESRASSASHRPPATAP